MNIPQYCISKIKSADADDYPRILLLTRNNIDEYGPKGASLGNWFQFWPKESIGIISSTHPTSNETPYTNNQYILTDQDISCSKIYKRLKRFKAETEFNSSSGIPASAESKNTLSLFKRLGMAYYRFLFRPKISKPMRLFIKQFQPDCIFACVEDLQIIGWTDLIAKKWNIPALIELEDNWFAPSSDISRIERQAQYNTWIKLQRLIKTAAKVYVIGYAMQKYLKKTFGINSDTLFCADLPARYADLSCRPKQKLPHVIRYTGSIGSRIDTITDLFDAAAICRQQYQMDIEVHIHGRIPDSQNKRLQAFWFYIHPLPHHSQIPNLLADSDVLFLSETYQKNWREYVSLALSSKTHIYMLAQVPIVAYGPKWAGVIEYAEEHSFAAVVHAPDVALLASTLRDCINKNQEVLLEKAMATANLNHNAEKVCKELLENCKTAAAFGKNAGERMNPIEQ